MIQINNVNEIKLGETYQITWEETQQVITVNSIEKTDKNSYYLNGNNKINFFDMIIEQLEDEDKVK